MSKQTRFVVLKQDFDEFLQFAEQKGFRSVPEIIESEVIRESELPTDFNVKTSADFFYLIPKPFSAVEAFYKELPNEKGFYKLIARTSPVIEVSPVKFESDEPVEGRIYICQDNDDPRFETALNADDLLARFLKKWPRSSDGKFHIGPRAFEFMRDF